MPEALKCPSCSASLVYPIGGGATMRCPYCGSTVVLSEDSPPTVADGDIPQALRPMVEKALEMAKASGRLGPQSKIEAIKFYRASTGAGLADAKKAVENLAAGRAADFGGGNPAFGPAVDATNIASTGMKFGCGLAMVIFVVVGLIVAKVLVSIHHQLTAGNQSWAPKIVTVPMPVLTVPQAPPAPTFAHQVMEFGSEGIGVGRFKDSRSIAIDGQGHIYVGEYSDGRVQVFDLQGSFVAEWSIGHGKSLMNLAAGRDGTVYAVVPGHILRYTGATGMPLGEAETRIEDEDEEYMDASVGPNGNLYAIGENSDIVVLSPDGKIQTVIKAAEKVGEDLHLSRIAVIGTGEMYALDREKGVFKFASDGRYINRFGGGVEAGAEPTPGHFLAPQNLAIDGQGRIYVSGVEPAIQVFSADGSYLDSFGDHEVVFGLAISDHDEIFACFRNAHSVRKFVLDKH
ncbi:MAG: hypothetical protein ABSC42_02700 [Tepidisphaeraceae bacterium]